jgi:membrane protease YdiL (CAAX protease family)
MEGQDHAASKQVLLSRPLVVLLSLGAAIGLSAAAALIIVFGQQRSLATLFEPRHLMLERIAAGSLLGLGLAVAIASLTLLPPLRPARELIDRVMVELRAGPGLIVLVGLCAGIGEEFLFRAALQPLVGIWVAALLFAFAHVGVTKLDRPRLAFAAYAFSTGALFGLFYEKHGLPGAAAAHAVYDIALLFLLQLMRRLGARRE